MTDLNLGARPGVNFELLDAELRAALPGKLDGIAWDKDNVLTVIVSEGEDANAQRGAIEAVLAAHDPMKLTSAQKETAARETVRTTLAAADFAAWTTNVKNATTLIAMKVLLLQLGRVVWMMAKAQGLTSTTDPGE